MIVRSGRDPARASLSARQAKEKGLLTSGTFGPPSTTSSSSASLQSSLESRCRAAVSMYGSILYKLTWKQWVTPSGLSRYRLRASAARTSGTGLSGWPTPLAADSRGRAGAAAHKNSELPNCVELAGWPTPDAGCFNINSSLEVTEARRQRLKEKHGNSNGAGLVIATAALMAGWPTPSASDTTGAETQSARSDRKAGGLMLRDLPHLVITDQPMRLCSDGSLLTGSSAGMESGGRLDPAHSRWLMRLPPVWDDCAVTAMQSMPKRSRNSTRH